MTRQLSHESLEPRRVLASISPLGFDAGAGEVNDVHISTDGDWLIFKENSPNWLRLDPGVINPDVISDLTITITGDATLHDTLIMGTCDGHDSCTFTNVEIERDPTEPGDPDDSITNGVDFSIPVLNLVQKMPSGDAIVPISGEAIAFLAGILAVQITDALDAKTPDGAPGVKIENIDAIRTFLITAGIVGAVAVVGDVDVDTGDMGDNVNLHALDKNARVDLGSGNDTIVLSLQNDTVNGGDGNDTFIHNQGAFPGAMKTLDGGDGSDVLLIQTGAASDAIELDFGGVSLLDVTVNGKTISYDLTSIERIEVSSGSGNDTVSVNNAEFFPGLVSVDTGDGFDVLTFNSIVTNVLLTAHPVGGAAPWPGGGSGLLELDGDTNEFVAIEELRIAGVAVNVDYSAPDNKNKIHVVGLGVTTEIRVDANATVVLANSASVLNLDTRSGDDDVLVDVSGGTSLTAINLTGGPDDELTIVNSAGPDTVNYTPTDGTDQAGVVDLGGGIMVNFFNFASLNYVGNGGNDTVTVTAPGSDNLITHTPGSKLDEGTVQIDSLVPLKYRLLGNDGEINLDGGGGDDLAIFLGTQQSDTFTIPAPGATVANPVQLNSQVVVGSTGVEKYRLSGLGGDDVFNVQALPGISILVEGDESANLSNVLNYTAIGNVTVKLADDEIEDTGAGISPAVAYSGIDFVNVELGGLNNLTVLATPGNDTITARPDGPDSATVEVANQPVIHGTRVVMFVVDANAGNDLMIVHGTPGNDAFTTVNDTQVAITGQTTIHLANLGASDTLRVEGLTGSDTFNVTPSATVQFTIDGGDPIGGHTGDSMTININGNVTFQPLSNFGRFDITGFAPVSYTDIEEIDAVTTGVDLRVNGTSSANFITVTATGSDDFDVAVDDALVSYTNINNMVVNAGLGDDFVVIEPISGMTTNITASGGSPSESDTLQVDGTILDDLFEVSLSPRFGFSINIDTNPGSIRGTIFFNTFAVLKLNALDGIDRGLVITGSDNYVYTPGADDDDGMIQTDELLIEFSGLGKGERISLFGETLTARGTDANDVFNLDRDGLVINGRATLEISGFFPVTQKLTMDGGEGDDTYNVTGDYAFDVPAEIADASGNDLLTLTGAGFPENVVIGPDASTPDDQDITGLGSPIGVSGVERIEFIGKSADPDTLNVNLGNGDNTARVDRGGDIDGMASDVMTSDSLPDIAFTGLANFTVTGGDGADVVTFAPWFLSGASGDYRFDGGVADRLVIEGVGGDDRFTVTNPAQGAFPVDPPVQVTTRRGTLAVVTAVNPALSRLQINGLGGDDGVTIDVGATDLIGVPITFDGGAGSDLMILDGTPATPVVTTTYTPGPAITEGRLTYDTNMTVDFVNLEPVVDLIPAASLVVNGTDADNAIDYRVGTFTGPPGNPINPLGLRTGMVSVDGFETIEFAEKANLTINGNAGDDAIWLNYGNAPSLLTTITVNGANGNDNITVQNLPAAVAATLNGNDGVDTIDASALTQAASLTINGGAGNDTLTGGAGDDTISGGDGDDLLAGGDLSVGLIGVNTYDGGAGFDTILFRGTSFNDAIDLTQDNPSGVVGADYTISHEITTNIAHPLTIENIVAVNGALAPSDPANRPSVEEVRVEGGKGNDQIRITPGDAYTDNNLASAVPTQLLRWDVDGGSPNASDHLVFRDAGLGDLTLVRQGADGRSGRITIAPAVNTTSAGPFLGDVVYTNIENVDITPLNTVTGGTGVDGKGRVVVFQADGFEMNDNRLIATEIGDLQALHRNPTIDPGVSGFVPQDEDWYEFRPGKAGTYRFDIFFDTVGTLANGRLGLSGDGNLTVAVYNSAGDLIVHGQTNVGGDGVSASFSAAGPDTVYYMRVIGGTEATPNPDSINSYSARVEVVDVLGPRVYDPDGAGPIQAIQVVTAGAPNANFNLFDVKPGEGPTPQVDGLLLNVRDVLTETLLRRQPGNPVSEVYPALLTSITQNPAMYRLVGDANGNIAITSVNVVNAATTFAGTVAAAPAPTVNGVTAAALAGQAVNGDLIIFTSGPAEGQLRTIQSFNAGTNAITFATPLVNAPAAGDTFEVLTIATATIRLNFAAPLPDDRFTLTINDGVTDPAMNAFDGESNAAQPSGSPTFPSGNGVAGGDFVARFTVDSRPELATVASGAIYIDINGNNTWDPEGQNSDDTNKDLVFQLGTDLDTHFAGNFAPAGAGAASGFDKIGSYGFMAGSYRFLLDFDHDGVADFTSVSAFAVAAVPVAGDFDPAHPGDEIGIFDGGTWYLDTDGDNVLELTDTIIVTPLRGLPIVGDFNGDGNDDLAVFNPSANLISFDLNRDGTADDALAFSPDFGFGDWPVAGDLNLDGVDDIGLWVDTGQGQLPIRSAEWYFLVSDRAVGNPSAIFDPFSPAPLGNDIFAQFGDDSALPLFGNFDPPTAVRAGAGSSAENEAIAGQYAYVNFALREDVNGDGIVSPGDALRIINLLNAGESGHLPPVRPAITGAPDYPDVNGDNFVSALDALIVINRLTSDHSSAEGEAPGAGVVRTQYPQRVASGLNGAPAIRPAFALLDASAPALTSTAAVDKNEPSSDESSLIDAVMADATVFAAQDSLQRVQNAKAKGSDLDDGLLDELLSEIADDVQLGWISE